ncbi:GCN5-related N-acetyltransferase 6, chloroplastic [Humulus lupulus]|uniref:GCN5-related N-acetyltransferase 6, chloroplastic n=1 Tax=Humulus lupulus TaxID=3486 RepID=UPI002B40C366|nr:GCN5-related N-acetyltransferase 6, chloroplastic [Humulus lupulus]XP_062091154.1 GCN5-related N-acetyltransferase 6, chloroplastic [Humulus lupulus]XP_062091156.1 GCN5-related N-acetyltransferase 6, chloroplastic [Humulus lupulus]XP_062091157.1 GCN5-related N-acetyltransferase 6, chloroplastic [Humulus lupulus]
MSTISIHKLQVLSFSHVRIKSHRRFHRTYAIRTMTMDAKSSEKRKIEEISVQIPLLSSPIPQRELLKSPDLQFNRLQPSERDLVQEKKLEFGQFVARDAILDEEFWTAAWLRAESHWEDRPSDRYVDNHKRKFAEQEFNAIKKRNKWQHGPNEKCACIVTVKKETKNVKRTVLKSVVGTLDLSIRYLLHGETFPGERVKAPLFCSINRTSQNRYGYIANLCVAKSARRQGIASNMLYFAVESAISDGVGQVYVHVYRDNQAAQELYHKMGFELVQMASSQLLEERTFLLCFKS